MTTSFADLVLVHQNNASSSLSSSASAPICGSPLCNALLPIFAAAAAALCGDVYAQVVLERRGLSIVSAASLRTRKRLDFRRTSFFVGAYVLWMLPMLWVWRSILESAFPEPTTGRKSPPVDNLRPSTLAPFASPEVLAKTFLDQAVGASVYLPLLMAVLSVAKYWRDGADEPRRVLNAAVADVVPLNWLLATPASFASFLLSDATGSVGLQLAAMLVLGGAPMAAVVSRRIDAGLTAEPPAGRGRRLALILPTVLMKWSAPPTKE